MSSVSGRGRDDGTAPTGLVLVDKPAGLSSFDIVRQTAQHHTPSAARKRVKAGHAGTLDPAATGLLLVLLGRATRLARYLVGLDKLYRTRIRLGETTTTGDAEGQLLERVPVVATENIASELVGELELPVPAASAVKIDGERAYARHRRGEDVEMPIRRSTVHTATVLERAQDGVTLELRVSSGTYIRAIAHRLGGHCVSIRRLSVGPFEVDQADETRVIPPLDALPFLPKVELDAETVVAVRHGRRVATNLSGHVRAAYRGELIAVLSCDEGVGRPETVLSG